MLDKIALTLLIIGGLNWGSIGIFQRTVRDRQPYRLCYRRSGGAVVYLASVP